MNRNFAYFSNVIQLRFWAFFYVIYDYIFPWTKKYLQKHQIKTFGDNEDKSHVFNIVSDPYYYTYDFFNGPEDFVGTMVKNEDGLVINPITTTKNQEKPGVLFPAYYGLVCYNNFLQSENAIVRQNIKAHADFIDRYILADGSIIIWQDFGLFGQEAPWYSGITQGIVASFMMRAHLLFPDHGYDKKIKTVLDFMLDPTIVKPMIVTSRDGSTWIEEYPMRPPSMVLNGFIFSVISLYEYGSMFGDKQYSEKGDEMLRSLVKSLHRFTYPVGVKHNVFQPKFGNINYQALHTYQFYHLYKLTGNGFFLALAKKYFIKTNWPLFCSFYGIKYDKNRFNINTLS
jgi:hypothetical protein